MSRKSIEVVRGSIDYLDAEVESLRPTTFTTAATLVGSTLRLAVVATGAAPTWVSGGWVGTPDTIGLARSSAVITWSVGNFPLTTYNVFAEITNGAETHIEQCGIVTIREF